MNKNIISSLSALLLVSSCSQLSSNTNDKQVNNQLLLNTPIPNVTKKPNILWIVTDDQRADSVGAYNVAQTGKSDSALGYVSSPNIDALAKEGVMFTKAYTNSPGCAPSRASMLMGLYPHHSGRYGFENTHNGTDISTEPLPVMMKKQGYQTALFGKKGVRYFEYKDKPTRDYVPTYDTLVNYKKDLADSGLTDYHKLTTWANGKRQAYIYRFSYPDGSHQDIVDDKKGDFFDKSAEIDKRHNILRAYTRTPFNTLIIGGESPQPAGKTLDGHIVNEFKRYLDNPNTQFKTPFKKTLTGPDTAKPLMMNLGFHFPHTPVLPPKSFRDQFIGKHYKVPDFSKEELTKLPPQLLKLYKQAQVDGLKPNEKQQAIADYYAFCAYGDSLIGEAVTAFKNYSKAQDREYIILLTVGDHGWQLGEQGIETKFSPWATSTQGVIIAVDSTQQRFPANKVSQSFVEYVDIAPTLLASAGTDLSQEETHLDGIDLAETIRSTTKQRDYVIGEINHSIGPRAYLRNDEFAFSMRVRKENGKPGRKYQPGEDIQWALTAKDADVELALYDLSCDKNEQDNIANEARYQAITQYFREKLANIILGDGRVEIDWTKGNEYHISNFAKGAHDYKLDQALLSQKPACE